MKVFLLVYKGKASSVVINGVKFCENRMQHLVDEEKIKNFLSADGHLMYKDLVMLQVLKDKTMKPLDNINNAIDENASSTESEDTLNEDKAEIAEAEEVVEQESEEGQLEQSDEDESGDENTSDQEPVEKIYTEQEINLMKVEELKEAILNKNATEKVTGLSKTELKELLKSIN